MEKHTAQFKYVVKSVPLSIVNIPPWSYAKHFIIMFVIRIGLCLNEIIKCDLFFFFLSLKFFFFFLALNRLTGCINQSKFVLVG